MPVSKRKCKWCKRYASEWVTVPAGTFCTFEHAMEFANQPKEREKADRKRFADKKRQVRRNPRKEALETAQKLARISRADDDGYVTCVTCGHIGKWNDGFDGGHWIPKGTSSYWMLDPDNIWPQCKPCNGNGMKYHCAESKFTLFMIERFGADGVRQMLNDANKTAKRSSQDFDDYIEKAKAEIKEHEIRLGIRG